MKNLKNLYNFLLFLGSTISICSLSACNNKESFDTYNFTYFNGNSINIEVPSGKDVKEYYPENTPTHDDGYHEYTYTWNYESDKHYIEKQKDTKISTLYTFTFYDKHNEIVEVPKGKDVKDFYPENTATHDDGFKEYSYKWVASNANVFIEQQSSIKISKEYVFNYANGNSKNIEVPRYGKVEDYFPKDHSDATYDEANKKLHYWCSWALDHDNIYLETSIDYDVYNVTYVMPEGAKNPSDNPTLVYSKTEVMLKDATCFGYTFDGWFTDSTYKNPITEINHPSGDLTIYGKFTPIVYKITYHLDGGTNNPNNPKTYTILDNEITLGDPTKEDCTFVGWYLESTFKTKIEKIDCKSCKDIDLYAKLSPTVYTITYCLDGGTNSKNNPSTYTFYDEITFEDPTKNGYAFKGWYEEDTFDTPITYLKNSKGNKSIYAKYERNTYTITYNTDGGSKPLTNPDTYTIDDIINLTDSEKTGYTFKGWYEDSSFKTKIEKIQGRYENLNLYAKFEANIYKIIFHLDETDLIQVTYNYYASNEDLLSGKMSTTIVSLPPTSFNPYKFAAEKQLPGFYDWNISTKISSKVISLNCISIQKSIGPGIIVYSPSASIGMSCYSPSKIKENIFVPGYYDKINFSYSLYCEKSYVVSSFSILNDYNQSIFSDRLVGKGSKDSAFTLKRDDFKNFLNVNLSAEDSSGNHGLSQTTLNSMKKCQIRELSFDLSKLNYNVNYDCYVELPSAIKSGYNFVKWEDENGKEYKSGIWKELNDVDLYPVWSLVTYNINYYLNGGINHDENPNTYDIETETISLKDPTRVGYIFGGWYEDETFIKQITEIPKGTYGTKNLYAKWTNSAYSLTLNSNGGTIKPIVKFYDGDSLLNTQIIGEEDKLNYFVPNNKEGKLFSGWYIDKELTTLFDFSSKIGLNTSLYAGWINYQGSYGSIITPTKVGDTINDIELKGSEQSSTFAFSPLTDDTIIVSSDSEDKSLYSVASLYEVINGELTLIGESSPKSQSDVNFTLSCDVEAGKLYYLIVSGKYTTSIGTISILFDGQYLPDTNYGTSYSDNVSYSVTYDKSYEFMNVEKEDKSFVGWFDENDNEYKEGIWETASDINLHAKWG